MRSLTADFARLRRRARGAEAARARALHAERLARRWEKLLALHASAGTLVQQEQAEREQEKRLLREERERRAASAAAAEEAESEADSAAAAGGSVRTLDVRGVASGLWASLRTRASAIASSLEDPAKVLVRQREQQIVAWQADGEAHACPLCATPFSLAVRKHHCRLCGRVVCASPHLTDLGSGAGGGAASGAGAGGGKGAPVAVTGAALAGGAVVGDKCSGSISGDAQTGRMGHAFVLNREGEPHPSATAAAAAAGGTGAGEKRSAATDAGAGAGGKEVQVRVCRECRDVICRTQYMLPELKRPTYLKLYEALMRLQREIEEGLPEFQEMVLGMQ